MGDWLIVHLASLQAAVMRALATELRAGGMSAFAFAFSLGALHAFIPGHGKAALAAYFLGTEAPIGKGVRVALQAALLARRLDEVLAVSKRLCCSFGVDRLRKDLAIRGPPGHVIVDLLRAFCATSI